MYEGTKAVSLSSPEGKQLSISQIDDLRLAASKLSGANRRSFQAEMSLKYCDGRIRLTESVFGWGRETVELGLAEMKTGITCVGAQSGFSGTKRWERRQPKAADTVRRLAESQAQQDPTFESPIAYTRLTAAAALRHLKEQGFAQEQLPSLSTMAAVLNRMGYRLRQVVKAKPQKNCQKRTRFLTLSTATTNR